MVSSAMELAVINACRGRIVGITAASAGPKSWPTAENTSVMTIRCRKSPSIVPGVKGDYLGAIEIAPQHDVHVAERIRHHPGRWPTQEGAHRARESGADR